MQALVNYAGALGTEVQQCDLLSSLPMPFSCSLLCFCLLQQWNPGL